MADEKLRSSQEDRLAQLWEVDAICARANVPRPSTDSIALRVQLLVNERDRYIRRMRLLEERLEIIRRAADGEYDD